MSRAEVETSPWMTILSPFMLCQISCIFVNSYAYYIAKIAHDSKFFTALFFNQTTIQIRIKHYGGGSGEKDTMNKLLEDKTRS